MEINQASGNQSVRGVTHYNFTIGNDVTRDIHCDVTMCNCNDIVMCTYMTSPFIMALLLTSFIMYYYAYLCYFIMDIMDKNQEQVSI